MDAVKCWVSVANGLPLEQRILSEYQGKSTTVQLIEYDPTIRIDPTVP